MGYSMYYRSWLKSEAKTFKIIMTYHIMLKWIFFVVVVPEGGLRCEICFQVNFHAKTMNTSFWSFFSCCAPADPFPSCAGGPRAGNSTPVGVPQENRGTESPPSPWQLHSR